ncbi:MAG: DUF11 domain-containing protein [Vicinamibacterales bacterium]
MFRMRISLCTLLLLSVTAASALAQGRGEPKYTDVARLGVGRTSFFPLPQRPVGQPGRLRTLEEGATLQEMAAARGMLNDVRQVLRLGGVTDAQVAADVLRVMGSTLPVRTTNDSCKATFAHEGEIVDCTLNAGDTLPWMAYRPDSRTPGIIKNVRYTGATVRAFLFRAYSRGKSYTIVIPKPCGNLSISEDRPSLEIVKTAPTTFLAGSQVTYTIAVRNAAPAGSPALTNVRVTDELPSRGGLAWTLASANGGACTLSGATLNCAFGTLAPSDFRTVTVASATPTPYEACYEQTNTARATADNAAPAEGKAESRCVAPKLTLAKVAGNNGVFTIGAAATFTMTVKNEAPAGASPAKNVVLSDTLPTNGGLEWAGVQPAACQLSGNALRCALGTIDAGKQAVVTVTSKPAPFAGCAAQSNTANVTSDGGLTASATAATTCAPPVLQVTKAGAPATFKQGGQAAFEIKVTNAAAANASPATSVKLTDSLPIRGGLTWESATADGGTCTLTGTQKGTLACDLGSIPAGRTVTVKVTSTLKTPRSACQVQTNVGAKATADGGLTATASDATLTCDPSFNFFADGFFGKDRRVRPIEGRETIGGAPVRSNVGPLGGVDFAQCSPMFGFDLGLAKELKNNWELAAKAGLALSVVQKDSKVREHEVLADIEANKYLRQRGGAFVGAGLSMWDLFHSDTFTPSALVHFGLPLGSHPSHPTHFVGEGRWLLREAGDIQNNYQFWGGVRVKF